MFCLAACVWVTTFSFGLFYFRSLFTTQAILCRDSLSWRVSEVKQSRITFETQLKLARGNICFGFFLVTLSRECKKIRTRYGSSSDMNWSLNITEDRCSFLLWSSSLTSWSPSDGYGGYAAVEILPRSALWVRIYRQVWYLGPVIMSVCIAGGGSWRKFSFWWGVGGGVANWV